MEESTSEAANQAQRDIERYNTITLAMKLAALSPNIYINPYLQAMSIDDKQEYFTLGANKAYAILGENLEAINFEGKISSDKHSPKLAKIIRSWLSISDSIPELLQIIGFKLNLANIILTPDLIEALNELFDKLYKAEDSAEYAKYINVMLRLVLDSGLDLQGFYNLSPDIYQQWLTQIYDKGFESTTELNDILNIFNISTISSDEWQKFRRFLSIPHLPKVLVNKILDLAINAYQFRETAYTMVIPTLLNYQNIDLSQGFPTKILQVFEANKGSTIRINIQRDCFFMHDVDSQPEKMQQLPTLGQAKYTPFAIYARYFDEYPKQLDHPELFDVKLSLYLYLRSLTLPTSPANQEYFDRFGTPTEPVSKYFGVERFFPEIAKYMEVVSPQKSIQNLRRSNSEKSSFTNKTKGGVLAFMNAFATENTPAGFLSINSAPSVINIIARLQQYVLEIPKGLRNITNVTKLYQQDIAQIISGVEIYFAESSILGSNSNPNSNSSNSLNLKSSINSGELIFEVRVNPKQEKSWNRFLQEMKNGGKEKKDKKNGKDKKYNDDTNTGWEIFSKIEKGVYRLTIPAGDSTDSLIATETLKVLRNALEPILKTLTNEKLDPAVSILESIQAGDQQRYLDALNALDQYQEEYKEKLLQDMQEKGSSIVFSQEELAEFGENFIPSFTNTDQVDQELTARFEQRLNQANTTNLKIDLEKFTDTYIKLEKELRTELSTKIPLKRWRQITPGLKQAVTNILKVKEELEQPNISKIQQEKLLKRQIQQAINQHSKLDSLNKLFLSRAEKQLGNVGKDESANQIQSSNQSNNKTNYLVAIAHQQVVTIQSAINEIINFLNPEFETNKEVLYGGKLQTTELPDEFLPDLRNQSTSSEKSSDTKTDSKNIQNTNPITGVSALTRLKGDLKEKNENLQKNQREVITKTLETPGILHFLQEARKGYIALLKSKYTPEHIYQEILAKYSQNLVLSSLLAGVDNRDKV